MSPSEKNGPVELDQRAVAVIDAVVPDAAQAHYVAEHYQRDAAAIAALLDAGWTHAELVDRLGVTGHGGRIDAATTYPAKFIAQNITRLQRAAPPSQIAAERRERDRAATGDNRLRADLRNALAGRRDDLGDRYLDLLDRIETATGHSLAAIATELTA